MHLKCRDKCLFSIYGNHLKMLVTNIDYQFITAVTTNTIEFASNLAWFIIKL